MSFKWGNLLQLERSIGVYRKVLAYPKPDQTEFIAELSTACARDKNRKANHVNTIWTHSIYSMPCIKVSCAKHRGTKERPKIIASREQRESNAINTRSVTKPKKLA